MLSILIPVYNFKISDLVHELHKQLIHNKVMSEIIVVDDASELHFLENQKLTELTLVKYERLFNNIGRSAIRNYLASKAKYEFLLFIDCDAQSNSSDFIERYLKLINLNTEVICGGVCYEAIPPIEEKFYLRWYYGIHREAREALVRTKNPYKSFSSFNFLIKANTFNKLQFDTQLKGYGHEDTLLGLEMEKCRIHILHINNSLLHIGLDETDVFLRKTEESVQNLIRLTEKHKESKRLTKEIKILRRVQFINWLHLGWLYGNIYKLFKSRILKNLKSRKPSLFCFDLYKLQFFFLKE